jgi:predicted phage replisome organizer
MSDSKRFYWLKLKEGFFNQKEIKKLRKIAGGDTYTIIYLKMQLKSLENNGSLYFENFEDDFVNELALELDENVDNVKVTLLYLEKHGLIEQLDNEEVDEFHLPAVKESTGSETNKAESMRRLRAKRKKVTMLPDVTKCRPELEKESELDKELDKEKEKEKKKTKKFSPPTIDEVKEYIKQMNYGIDGDYYYSKMESIGWMSGKNKIVSWKGSIATWEMNRKKWEKEKKCVAPVYETMTEDWHG